MLKMVLGRGGLNFRHCEVVDAIGRVAWQMGAQAQRRVEGLDPDSRQRSDLADVCAIQRREFV